MINEFSPSDITILDDWYNDITEKMVAFLNTFDADRLLFNFRLTAGLPNKAASSYIGWENSRIGGHTLGHYLAAAAQAVARGYGPAGAVNKAPASFKAGTAGAPAPKTAVASKAWTGPASRDGRSLEERLDYILSSLAECQDALGTGFIFGATMADPKRPELQFDLLEEGNPRDTWVPWYTTHKIINGLVECWKSAGKRMALVVAERFAAWIWRRVGAWSDETQETVLKTEYGGMNDCLYELYKCARDDGYAQADDILAAAHKFDEEPLFRAVSDAWAAGSLKADALRNRHANTTIPKFVGAMNAYMTLAESGAGGFKADTSSNKASAPNKAWAASYLEYAERFWDTVVGHHSYITGGNSECEHFGDADILDAERSNSNCETCNTHNMLKLTRMLFQCTGERKYADYYENTFLNAIMASVNENDGMTLYFQPMATGLFKCYCNPDVNRNFFWCCTGTGLENFTKLGNSIYFHADDTLFVNQYISSRVEWREAGITLEQHTDMPVSDTVRIVVKKDGAFKAEKSENKASAAYKTDAASGSVPDNKASSASKAAGARTIALRLPDWLATPATLSLNGSNLSGGCALSADKASSACKAEGALVREEGGFLLLTRDWQDGDELILTLPMQIVPYSLADNAGRVYAFKYGPVVLAAELDRDKKYFYQIGVATDVAGNKLIRGQEMTLTGNYGSTSGIKPLPAETLLVNAPSVSAFMDSINTHFERIPGTLRFILKDTSWPGELVFSPYYRIVDERFGIYWLFTDDADEYKQLKESGCASGAESGLAELQGIGVGYGAQTEGNVDTFPFLDETGAGSCGDPHEMTRFAREGGGFSYMMKVRPEATNFLECTFLKEDNGKSLYIASCGRTIGQLRLDYAGEAERYTCRFELPSEIVAKAEALSPETAGMSGENLPVVRIQFSGIDDAESARIAGCKTLA